MQKFNSKNREKGGQIKRGVLKLLLLQGIVYMFKVKFLEEYQRWEKVDIIDVVQINN